METRRTRAHRERHPKPIAGARSGEDGIQGVHRAQHQLPLLSLGSGSADQQGQAEVGVRVQEREAERLRQQQVGGVQAHKARRQKGREVGRQRRRQLLGGQLHGLGAQRARRLVRRPEAGPGEVGGGCLEFPLQAGALEPATLEGLWGVV